MVSHLFILVAYSNIHHCNVFAWAVCCQWRSQPDFESCCANISVFKYCENNEFLKKWIMLSLEICNCMTKNQAALPLCAVPIFYKLSVVIAVYLSLCLQVNC